MNSRNPSDPAIEEIFRGKKAWHAFQRALPIKKKVGILLELQKQDFPLLKKHRRLEWWERP